MKKLENCPAPGKLNLFLHVVGRRADGYHLLQSAFRLIDLADTLSFSLREDGKLVRLDSLPGVPLETDLVMRAAKLLQRHTACPVGAEISLNKQLPLGGGLGGGSSDAATTLIALNRLWQTGLDRNALARLGLALGADVPFFIFGENAFVEGIGEKMQSLPLAPACYVVVHPSVSVPTHEIFSAKELTRDSEPIRIADFVTHELRNDLQPVAARHYPAVERALAWLGQYGPARMTGSGACVFTEVENWQQAQVIAAQCPPEWRAWAANGLDRHPLHDWLS